MSISIADGCRVSLHCRITDSAGAVLDDGSKTMVFVCGRQQVIAGLENPLRGREPGYHCRIELLAEDAYGPHRKELVFEAVRENLPAELDIQPGMLLSPGGGEGRFQLKVLSLTERGVLLDGNHQYAGKNLIFEVEVLAVEAGIDSANG